MKDLSPNCMVSSVAWLTGKQPFEILEWTREIYRDDGSACLQDDGCGDEFLSVLINKGWRVMIPSTGYNMDLPFRRGLVLVPAHAFAVDLVRGKIFDTNHSGARDDETIEYIAIPPEAA